MQRADILAAIEKLQSQGVDLKTLKKAAQRLGPRPIRRQRYSWAYNPREKDGPCRSLSVNEMLAAGYKVDES